MAARMVEVSGSIKAMDHENFGENEHGEAGVGGLAVVSDSAPVPLVTAALGVGGEVRVELDLQVSVADGDQIRVQGTGKLFEGDSEDTLDLEDEEPIDLLLVPDVETPHSLHLHNSGAGGGDTGDIALTFTNVVAPTTRVMPRTVEEANAEFGARRASLLRAWGRNFRLIHEGRPQPWIGKGSTTMRHIAAGMAVFADESKEFGNLDWALFSGRHPGDDKATHLAAFKDWVELYFDEQVAAFSDIGTELDEKFGPEEKNGDYDFLLRDAIALIHLFLDKPKILTNRMIRKLICQDRVSFVEAPSGEVCASTGSVPFAGQDLEEYLAEGPDGRHYFEVNELLPFPVPIIPPPPLPPIPIPINPRGKVSTPETENHQLGIYTWRYLVNEYLRFVATLTPDHPIAYRRDACLKALYESDRDRYENRDDIIDWVLQLLGRTPHSGLFESNARPYQGVSMLALMAFYQAGDRLFPDDPQRQKVKVAAGNALDYLAAEFAFSSFEGKRMAPFRRNWHKRSFLNPYTSDYTVNMFGVLTGAYVFPDDDTGPYRYDRIDQEGGFALWSLLSGYRVPRGIHDFMLNKHGGYASRVQTRYSTASYPTHVTTALVGIGPIGVPPTPDRARPRYFQDVHNGTPPQDYDVAGPGQFTPVTQLFFTTPTYLLSAGGSGSRYNLDGIDVPLVPDGPFEDADEAQSYNTLSRPTTLMPRGHVPIAADIGSVSPSSSASALERSVPTMRGHDDYWDSQNLSTYKNFALGYTSNRDDDRHLDWPQRYPADWNDFLFEERPGIGRAGFLIFDFTAAPEHPLAGHYWVLAQFSKSENEDDFRLYGRGFWEVVPGHRFPDPAALIAQLHATNPASHFDNDEDHSYTYRLLTTGERVVIENRFGTSEQPQGIVEIYTANDEQIPLNRYHADVRAREALRSLPLMDVWQVDRDYDFTGQKYAHADGRGRISVNNPFVGQNLQIDSSNYREPSRSVDDTNLTIAKMPPIPGTAGQGPNISALALSGGRLYVTQYYFPLPGPTPSPQPGELLALDPVTLAVLNRMPVGRSPHSIAVHESSQTVYVLNYDDISLSVVDGTTFAPIQTMKFLGFGPHEVTISQKFHRLFVTQPGQKRVLVIDGATRAALPDLKDLPVTGGMVLDEDTDRLYVSVKHAQDPKLQDIVEFEIHAGGQKELRRVTVDNQVSRAPELAVDAERVYVVGNGARPGHGPGQKLIVLDRSTLTLLLELPLNTGGGLAVAASQSQRIVCVSALADTQVIDTRTWQVLRKYPNPGQVKGTAVVDEPTGSLYFAGSQRDLVHGSLKVPMGE